MNGYFSRLLGQSGMPVAPVSNPHQTADSVHSTDAGAAFAPSADLIEQHIHIETTSPARRPAAALNVSEAEALCVSSASTDPLLVKKRSAAPIAASTPDPPGKSGLPQRETDSTLEKSSIREPVTARAFYAGSVERAATPPATETVREEHIGREVIRNVVAWIATDSTPAKPLATESRASDHLPPEEIVTTIISPSPAQSRIISKTPPRVQPAGGGTSSPEPEVAPTAVHIGAIHLTIEASPEPPRANRSPAAPAPRAPSPVRKGSRLQRHYLRPS
jgi:hypothetical protein